MLAGMVIVTPVDRGVEVGVGVGVDVGDGVEVGEGVIVGVGVFVVVGSGGGHVGIMGIGVRAYDPPNGPISLQVPSGSVSVGSPASINGKSNANPSETRRSLKSWMTNRSPISAISRRLPKT